MAAYSDVIVGAPIAGDVDNEGRVYVYLGSASGLATNPAWTKEGDQPNAQLSISVSTAGDVNRDGYSDVIVGAWRYDNGQLHEGLGNEARGGWIHAPQQRRFGGLAPIAVLGRSNEPTKFQIRARFERTLTGFDWAAPGAPTVRLRTAATSGARARPR